jgi:hypothetical protein
MSNIRFSMRNLSDAGVITASPALVSRYSPAALQRQDRWDMARSTFAPGLGSPLTAQQIFVTWPSAQSARMVALRMHNFSTSAYVRVRHFSDTARTTEIFNSDYVIAFSNAGLNTTLDVHTERDFRTLKNFVLYHQLLDTIRATEVSVLDPVNPDGYVEASRLIIADFFELASNPAYGGLDLVVNDASFQDAADDGTLRTDKMFKFRTLKIALDIIEEEDVPDLLALMRYQGLDKDFFVDCFPGDTSADALYHRAVMKLTSLDAINQHTYNLRRSALQMRES